VRDYNSKIGSDFISILAIVVLIGVLTMTFGFIKDHLYIIYTGVFVTAAASLLIFIQTVIAKKV
jgi:hypothetical protein